MTNSASAPRMGFLINGTANNAASSPFAMAQAFGNNRRASRSLYNGNLGVIFDNSTFDARPFSLTGQETPRLDYNHVQGVFAFGGPIKIPHFIRNGPELLRQLPVDKKSQCQHRDGAHAGQEPNRHGRFLASFGRAAGPTRAAYRFDHEDATVPALP